MMYLVAYEATMNAIIPAFSGSFATIKFPDVLKELFRYNGLHIRVVLT